MSPRVNPIEYDSRRSVNQSRKAWVAPAASVRISTFRPGRCPAVSGQLRQRLPGHGDVVGGGVRSGVPGPQHQVQRFTGAGRAVVDERAQRMEPVAAFERRLRRAPSPSARSPTWRPGR